MDIQGQQIYVFGGMYHNKFLNTMYKIDLEEAEVYRVVSTGVVPDPRAYHKNIQYGNKIIYFGGFN